MENTINEWLIFSDSNSRRGKDIAHVWETALRPTMAAVGTHKKKELSISIQRNKNTHAILLKHVFVKLMLWAY